ncbi:hypothetical protein, conserved [Angomonas deanei]|uniref:Uncharacterized protein n=1 Tax=Angomonas deanei TaxID=59799 RepID=A0A7G2BZ89_9TRYP|nr:hypothetical protein, conserved [Angomonas deanei]
MSGRRKISDEKQLLTEIGKSLRAIKASYKEAKVVERNEKKKKQRKSAKKEVVVTNAQRKARRTKKGGSLWITLKGGFSSHLPGRNRHDAAAARQSLTFQKRMERVQLAEQYIESAVQQAKEAHYFLKGSDASGRSITAEGLTEEGLPYMREQWAVAVSMITGQQPVGSTVRDLLHKYNNQKDTTATTNENHNKKGQEVLKRNELEDLITREEYIKRHPLNVNLSHHATESLDELVKRELENNGKDCYIAYGETENESLQDVDHCQKCIVKMKNSCGGKHTSILHQAKSVQYFNNNFMAALKKELQQSALPNEESAHNTNNNNAGAKGGKGQGAGGKKKGGKRK